MSLGSLQNPHTVSGFSVVLGQHLQVHGAGQECLCPLLQSNMRQAINHQFTFFLFFRGRYVHGSDLSTSEKSSRPCKPQFHDIVNHGWTVFICSEHVAFGPPSLTPDFPFHSFAKPTEQAVFFLLNYILLQTFRSVFLVLVTTCYIIHFHNYIVFSRCN